ncbi:MAG TPA: DNA recombination protein RmuC [Bacteroidales bacterium]|nr:DNA recombination protein RmuC [Bacteroidales bacterium]HSA44206.1 DNA recombination protein RmuC [Bacteroidales bacterium]
MEAIYIFAGLLAGFISAWLIMNARMGRIRNEALQSARDLENRAVTAESNLESLKLFHQDNLSGKDTEIGHLKAEIGELRSKNLEMSNELVKGREAARYLEQRLEEQKVEIQQLRTSLQQEFENIANRLFKTHSKDFSEASTKNLNDLLNPLKERIQQFEQKVHEAYDKEMREKISLKEEVKQLFMLNQRISEEASNLTKALKGDVKKMGNWGEVMLERILEQSGLEKGSMYQTQVSSTDEDGRRYQPDVVVYLPDKKHIIIDAKVSLLAYEKYTNADTEEERRQYIKEHLNSVYTHVKLLSSKNYQAKADYNSPDFVLLFIPVEASFSAAIREDAQVFDVAWENKIVIVSPSTLLATLKTIQSIWKQENQNRNAMEIARQGAGLFDKFVGFLEDLQKVGKSLNDTQKAYEDAVSKLHTGKGNLVSRVQHLQKLGIKPGKGIPERFTLTDESMLTENTDAD